MRVRLKRALMRPVNVLSLTILVSSCLAGIFICCFAAEYRRCRNKSLERDSLLPLNDTTVPADSGKIIP